LSLLKDLDHANIVKLEDFFVQNGYFYIVFELMSMDLKKFMDLMPHGELMNKTLVKIYCRQVTLESYVIFIPIN